MMLDRLWARYGHIWAAYEGVVRHVSAAASRAQSSRSHVDTSRRFQALWEIQGRSCLVALEISCLSRGGFPHGAAARARTLLELAVTADILATCDRVVMQRYDHQVLRTTKTTAATYAKHAVDLFGPHAADDAKEAEAEAQRLKTVIDSYRQTDAGAGLMNGTLWWARDEILRRGHILPPKKLITFEDLASTTPLAAWLPFYRHFNRPIHAGGEGQSDLYTSGNQGRSFLVGPTDSGYVDPAQVALECVLRILGCLSAVAKSATGPDPELDRSLRVSRRAADEVIEALSGGDPRLNGEWTAAD